DVFGRREVQTEAACFQTDEEDAAGLVGLEAQNALLSVRRLAVEPFEGDLALFELGLDDVEQHGELREDEGLLALIDDGSNVFEQRLELGTRIEAAIAIHETRMTRDLPQAEQRLEHVHRRTSDAVSPDASEERRLIVLPYRVVRRSLRRGHDALDGLFDSRRK